MSDRSPDRPHVGWREWVDFPALGLPHMKAKVDTGARTSALHAFEIEHVTVGGVHRVAFDVHPFQRDDETSFRTSAVLVDERDVTSSNGQVERRLVVETDVRMGEHVWPVEITLTNRDNMGFRLLLGRTALAGRFLVDPSRSYLQSAPPPRATRHT